MDELVDFDKLKIGGTIELDETFKIVDIETGIRKEEKTKMVISYEDKYYDLLNKCKTYEDTIGIIGKIYEDGFTDSKEEDPAKYMAEEVCSDPVKVIDRPILSDWKIEQLQRMPIIHSETKLSKDRKTVIHITTITDLKPAAELKAVLEG